MRISEGPPGPMTLFSTTNDTFFYTNSYIYNYKEHCCIAGVILMFYVYVAFIAHGFFFISYGVFC